MSHTPSTPSTGSKRVSSVEPQASDGKKSFLSLAMSDVSSAPGPVEAIYHTHGLVTIVEGTTNYAPK